jgi:adenylate kinase family enzyme
MSIDTVPMRRRWSVPMQRVVMLGRGAAGKSTLARRLGAVTGLPVVELDAHFWTPGLHPSSPRRWAEVQEGLAAEPRWIMDGDLGPYDVLDVRLRRADTVVLLDLPFLTCAWRAVRRSRERSDFWLWVWSYRRRWRPLVATAVARSAPEAQVRVLRSPRAVTRFLDEVTTAAG